MLDSTLKINTHESCLLVARAQRFVWDLYVSLYQVYKILLWENKNARAYCPDIFVYYFTSTGFAGSVAWGREPAPELIIPIGGNWALSKISLTNGMTIFFW